MTGSDSSIAKLIRVLLGLLLISAAVLKANALGSEQISVFAWLSNPRWQVAIIEVEAILGMWLLSGRHRRNAWLMALVVFALLGAASLYMALTGQRSCGCFGRAEVNPFLTFGIDIFAVAALAVTLPPRNAGASETVPQRRERVTEAGIAIFLVLIASPFLLASEDLMDALAWMRGETVTLEPILSDVGEGAPGEVRVIRVRAINHTARPIRIVGGTQSCDCTTMKDLPLLSRRGKQKRSRCVYYSTARPAGFSSNFLCFWMTAEKAKTVVARYRGRVKSTAE